MSSHHSERKREKEREERERKRERERERAKEKVKKNPVYLLPVGIPLEKEKKEQMNLCDGMG